MQGVHAENGSALSGEAHLRQSIRDILTTPIGSRVMRREYGSRLFELVDAPQGAGRIADMIAATAEALDRWEPRYRLHRAVIRDVAAGHVTIDLDGVYPPQGVPLPVEGIVV